MIGLFPAGLWSHAGETTLNGQTFQVADGYTLEVAVPPSLVQRPVEADFDSKGRLYVSESSGSNAPVAEQLEKKPHRLLQLSDKDGDGSYEDRKVFADGLMLPEGVLCHGGSIFVAAPPQIWKFTDGDDDGVAERREEWFDGKTLTGCANDLHGPYAGPDGRIYWCKGAFAEQTHNLPGKPGWQSRASHVFRARPDGTNIECVFTAGMDNPVGLAWTPENDLMVSGTFLQHPEAGRRDGIIHAVPGGVWGKDHDVLDGHPRTGALMPPMTHLGPAAAAGMCRYGRDLLVCQFNLRMVSRHELFPDGATYRTVDTPLLISDHPDFHPTDVLQAPDGSILVIDTGGWYKLCCPTSQIAKPEVPGAIYRLRRTSGEIPCTVPPPRWKLHSVGNLEALCRQLQSENRHVVRRAVEELGRWPARRNSFAKAHQAAVRIVGPLLQAASLPDMDRFLEHAITFALLEGGDPGEMRAQLAGAGIPAKRMLLMVLSQKAPEIVDPRQVAEWITSRDAGLRDALRFAFVRVPAWKFAASIWLRDHFSALPESEKWPIFDFALAAEIDLVPVMETLMKSAAEPASRIKIAGAMRAAARRGDWPDAWGVWMLGLLESENLREATAAAEFFSSCGLDARRELEQRLGAFVSKEHSPAELRVRVLANPRLNEAASRSFPLLLDALATAKSAEDRMRIAEIISRTSPAKDQLQSISGIIARTGMLENRLLLRAFRNCADPGVGRELVLDLERSGMLAVLSKDVLGEALAGFPSEVRAQAEALRRKNDQDKSAQAPRLDELDKKLPAGDAQRGSVVFQSAKASCVLCHKIGYKGGTLGPDLSRVGSVRTRRDLLEAVVFPSASFVRSYEPVDILRTDGGRMTGIIRNQNANAITLGTGAATPDAVVKLGEIRQMHAAPFSLMPAGLDRILTEQELADLIAFLQAMK